MAKSKNHKNTIILAICTLGVGFSPIAPGTCGALAAVVLFILIKNPALTIALTALGTYLAFLLCGKAEKILNKKDAKQIVIDDFSGQLIALLFLPFEAKFIFLAFLLFRAFDIIKIPPSDLLEKKQGSIGVVGDDVVAGIYANLAIQLARLLLHIIT